MNAGLEKNKNIGFNKKSLFNRLFSFLSVGNKAEITPANEADEIHEIIQNLKSAREEWISANMDFEYAGDQNLVDYYTYKIKAYQIRYEYFLKLAKVKGIKVEPLETTGNTTN